MSVGGDANDITINSDGGLTGWLEIGGDLLGTLRILQNVSGTDDEPAIAIGGDLTGRVLIAGKLQRTLEVGGDVDSGSRNPAISIDGELTDEIRVKGSLCNGANDYDILVGSMSTSGAITVDWDGWDSLDSWEEYAVVRVGSTNYEGNDADANVLLVTQCRADMDNDESIDFDDIDPFVAAFDGQEDFEAEYPGRGGSMIFHGSLDCDNDIDFDDVDPFVTRLSQGCCWEECGSCDNREGGGGGRLAASELAEELASHIAPQRYDALCDMIAEVAERQRNARDAAYWLAVWEYLTE